MGFETYDLKKAVDVMLRISQNVTLPISEIEFSAIRAQGSGGQNVNKVSSAAHLRFDIQASSLPDVYKQRLLQRTDQRITKEGVVVIKAQQFRSLEKNKAAALERLCELIQSVATLPKKRKPTQPGINAKARRMDRKTQRGRIKSLRGKIDEE